MRLPSWSKGAVVGTPVAALIPCFCLLQSILSDQAICNTSSVCTCVQLETNCATNDRQRSRHEQSEWKHFQAGSGVGRGRHGNRHSASKLQPHTHLFNVDHDISVRQLHACCRCKVNWFTRSEHSTRSCIYRYESLSDTTGVGSFYVVQASFKHFVCALDVTHVQQLYHIPELQQQGHDETGNM